MVHGKELVVVHRIVPSILAILQCMVGGSVEVCTKIILYQLLKVKNSFENANI